MAELLPCPFCGTPPGLVGPSHVSCEGSDCFMSYSGSAASIAAWNTRTPDPALLAEALKAEPFGRVCRSKGASGKWSEWRLLPDYVSTEDYDLNGDEYPGALPSEVKPVYLAPTPAPNYADGWRAAIEAAAKVAYAHAGEAKRARLRKRPLKDPDGLAEVAAEERGEDIASELIAAAIRAMKDKPA